MIVVTGASGLLGSALVTRLAQDGIPTRGTVRGGSRLNLLERHRGKLQFDEADILDMPALLKILAGAETVVHCAALVSFNPRARRKILEANVQGSRNVVNACLKLGIPKMIHVSSVAALGRPKGSSQVDETSIWAPAAADHSNYGESKYLAELEAFRGMEEGLNVSVINPSVIFAPADGQRSSSRIFEYVWGQGSFYSPGTMNYVDVNDVCEMIVRLLHGDHNGERYIASAGCAELKVILDHIASRFQRKAPSIEVPLYAARIAAWIETRRSALTGREPLVTNQSLRFIRENLVYENAKAKQKLGMEFQTLEKTLDWCCREFRNNNTNK